MIVVVLVSSFFCLFFSKVDLTFIDAYSFSDIGHQLYNFKMTLLGEVPYRDFWENWAPGTFYLNALAFKLFGVSIYSTKLLLAIFMAISSIVLFLISKEVVPRPIALAIALVSLLWGNFTLNIPYSGWFANSFELLALLGFFKYYSSEKRKLEWLALTGLALGLAFTFKQNVGSLSSVAIATAVVASIHAGAPDNQDILVRPGKSSFFRCLLISSELVLLLLSYVVLPYLYLRTIYGAGLKLRLAHVAVFYVPILAVNTFMLISVLNLTVGQRGGSSNFRELFLTLLKRELALAGGFAVAVAPWFYYFSELLGWSEFYRIITLTHPMQENFKILYPRFGQLSPLSATNVMVLLVLMLICAIIAYFFIASNSKRRLYIGTAALAGILVVIGLRISSILRDASPLYYFSSFLAVALIVALFVRYSPNFFSSRTPKGAFLTLTVAIFSTYNFLWLSTFADNNHYQMNVFPWLVLMGCAVYLLYAKAISMLLKSAFAPRWRKGGILVAVAFPFLLLYVGKSVFAFRDMYSHNVKYCKDASQNSDKPCGCVLKKMDSEDGGVYVNSVFLEEVNSIVTYIRENTNENDYLLVSPSSGVFNFLADRKCPSKYRYFLFDFLSDDQQRELRRELEEKQPACIILDTGLSVDLYRKVIPTLFGYMGDNYVLEEKIGRFYLFRRKPRPDL